MTTPAPETIQSILERAKILYSVKEISAKLSVDAKTISRWIKNESTPSALMIPGIKEALFGKPQAQKPSDFTFIDLFAGIGGIRLGFESAGGCCVFTSEWNKHSQKTYMTNFMDEHPIADDITKLDADSIPDHDVLVGGFPCFAKGTLVHAFDGLRPIEAIREGDMVLGQSGEFRRVGAAMLKHDAPTRQLRIMGCPELTTTDEHPFWARRSALVWNPSLGKHEREMSPATWVDAQDLNGDHFVGFPIDQEMNHSTSSLPEERKSTSFWFAAGQWLGHETHATEEHQQFISEFEPNPAMRELPGYCFHLPKALQSALLHGWMSAQGPQTLPDARQGKTSSEKLALGMARIARNVLSTTPTIRKQKSLDENATWRLILSTRASPHFFCDGSFVWGKVRKNQTTGKTETVHNIAVDVDESYVVEGALVHNCQPFSIAGVSKKASMGRKHGFEDKTQGTLFFDVARIIKAKQPKAFMLENVKNLLSHDKGNTFKIIKETLEKDLGYTISHRVIDGQHFTPQHRERILIVGFRQDVGFDFSKLALPAQGPKLASILHPQNGTEKIMDDCISGAKGIIGAKYTITDNLWAYLQAYAAKHKAAGNGFGFGMVGPQSVTRTLSARYYKDGSEILIDQGKKKNPRRLTPRECARLQGFPDHYTIPVSDSQAYKQFGNSVVVPVMAAVAAHMKPHLMGLIAAQAAPAAPPPAATPKTKKKK